MISISLNTYSTEDRFEDYNRKIWAFNEFLDDNFAKPTAEVYTSIAPEFVEIGLSNFFRNLGLSFGLQNCCMDISINVCVR